MVSQKGMWLVTEKARRNGKDSEVDDHLANAGKYWLRNNFDAGV
jgi:hypothetical protein